MRKFIILLLSIVLLSACGNTVKETDKEQGQGNSNEQSDNQEQTDTGNDVDDTENATNEEDESEEPETSEEEVVKQYRLNDTYSVVPIDDADENIILLTIDDAPDKYSLEMAKTLKELDAPAIFFVNGHFLTTPESEEILTEIHEMGFPIGNHTYSHKNLKDLTEEEQREEIISVSDRVEEIIGERPKFFRAPHGSNTDFSEKLVAEEKMLLMNWTYGYDYFEPYMDKDKIVEAMISGEGPEVDVPYSLLKPGANLLMHDREWTNAGLKEIVEGLRAKGYEPVDPSFIETPGDERE